MKLLICLFVSAQLWAFNSIRVLNPTGSTQTDVPMTDVGRMFANGEMCNVDTLGVKPYIDGVAASRWQSRIVNYWPVQTGTWYTPGPCVQFVVIDFVIPSLPTGGVSVDFRQSTVTSEGGAALTKAAVEAATWNGDARFTFNTGTGNEFTITQDVKTIFSGMTENESCSISSETSSDRKLRRWRDGPVLTQWIIEDRCTSISLDFGAQWDGAKWVNAATAGDAYKSLHPYYILTAYRNENGSVGPIKLRHVVTNPWNRKYQNQVYRQRFRVGPTYGETLNEETIDYTHIAGSVYYWEGWATSATHPQLVYDPNLPYLIHSKAIPAYITEPLSAGVVEDKMIPVQVLNDLVNKVPTRLGTFNSLPEKPQYVRTNTLSCRGGQACALFWTKPQQQGGVSHELSLVSTHYMRWLYFTRNTDISASDLLNYWNSVVVGQVHAGSNMPVFYLESRSASEYCPNDNCPTTAMRTGFNEFGRTLSIAAHGGERIPSTLGTPFRAVPAGCSGAPCTPTSNGWSIDNAHFTQPFYLPALLTGDYHYLRQLWGLAAYVLPQTNAAATTHISGNGRMNCQGWGGGIGPRGPAWRIRNAFNAITLHPESPEKEDWLKQIQNTIGCEEGYAGLTTEQGAKFYNTNAGSPWRFGNDIWRMKDNNGATFTNVSNPLFDATKRIVGGVNSTNNSHQSDSYDLTKINSANGQWMKAYYIGTLSWFAEWFDWPLTYMRYMTLLHMEGLKRNPFVVVQFNEPTHKSSTPRKEVISATVVATNTIRFTVNNHGYPNSAWVTICCANSAAAGWSNNWHVVESSQGKWSEIGQAPSQAHHFQISNVTTDTFDINRTSFASVTGSYPACCTVSGGFKLWVARAPVSASGWSEDGGPFQSIEEYWDAFHPIWKEQRSGWPSYTTVARVSDKTGAYVDTVVAGLLSPYVDHNLADARSAKKLIRFYRSNTWDQHRASSLGTTPECVSTPPYNSVDNFCGNIAWAVQPRPKIENLAVRKTATSLKFEFVAPTGHTAKVAVTTGTFFPDSRTASDLSCTMKGRFASCTVESLTSGVTYRYRITAGAMGGTTRVEGTATTL